MKKGRFYLDTRPRYKEEISRLISLNEFYRPYMGDIFNELQINYGNYMHNIIDIGAGTGHTTALLKEFFPNSKVVYFDISNKLCDYAKNNFKKIDKFMLGDIFDFVFAEKYDFVFSRYALKHLFDPEKAIEIMTQILNKKGIICLMDKDVSANIWYPSFPLYKTNYMMALNKYNQQSHRGGDQYIGRKIKHYLIANGIEIIKEMFLLFDLTLEENVELRKQYVEVYENLLPELVNEGLLDYKQGKNEIKLLKDFLKNKSNTAITVDFIIVGQKK